MPRDPGLDQRDSSEVPMFATRTGQTIYVVVVLALAATLAFAVATGQPC